MGKWDVMVDGKGVVNDDGDYYEIVNSYLVFIVCRFLIIFVEWFVVIFEMSSFGKILWYIGFKKEVYIN